MLRNRTKEKLAGGEIALGCFVRYPDPALCELLALHELDFLVFDSEHGPLSPWSCEQLVRSVELCGVTPMVRVERNEPATVTRYLDTGAGGCHIPSIDSRDAALAAVRAVKFPPLGGRGLAASRSARFGLGIDFAEYVGSANQETLVVVHVETCAGVAAAKEIASVDGVDVLLFGALDLSQDMSCPGRLDDPRVRDAGERVADAANAHGKAFGAVVGDPRAVHSWLEKGARYIVTTVEALLAPGIRGFREVVSG